MGGFRWPWAVCESGHDRGFRPSQWTRIGGIGLCILFLLGRVCAAERGSLPQCLVYLPTHRTSHAIVVEKSTAKLFLYRSGRTGLRLVKEFPCSLGKVEGEKSRSGDQKTPSGIFWLEDYIPQKRLHKRYGAGAFVLNYPNFFDRLEGREGDGIWIHGTHLPERVRLPRDTDGCVVLKNQDFREIRRIVRLFQTPVIVEPQVVYLDPLEWHNQRKNLLERLQRWLGTWCEDAAKTSDSLYSERFRSDPKGANHFLKLRRALVKGLRQSRVRIKDLVFLRNGSMAISVFIQEWHTEHGLSRWTKALYWLREGDLWRILGEEVLERPVMPSADVMGDKKTS